MIKTKTARVTKAPLVSSIVACALLRLCITTALAIEQSSQSVPVTIDSEPATFSVVLPTSLPVYVDSSGVVKVADNASIKNMGTGPVRITGLSVYGSNGWVPVAYGTNYLQSNVGTKQFDLDINGSKTTGTSDKIEITSEDWPSIAVGSSQSVIYTVNIAPQSSSVQEQIATVVFTVGWDLDDTEVNIVGQEAPESLFKQSNGWVGGIVNQSEFDEYLKSNNGVLILPSQIGGQTVREIGNTAFQDQSGIKQLKLPEGVETVGISTFRNCTSLEVASMPNSLTSIGAFAFADNGSLRNIRMPPKLETWETWTFARCTKLESIAIPEGVTALGNDFQECESLAEVKLPSTLELMDGSTFYNCKSLTSIEIPKSIQQMRYEFVGCTALKEININKPEGSVAGAPWSAPNAKVNWLG